MQIGEKITRGFSPSVSSYHQLFLPLPLISDFFADLGLNFRSFDLRSPPNLFSFLLKVGEVALVLILKQDLVFVLLLNSTENA